MIESHWPEDEPAPRFRWVINPNAIDNLRVSLDDAIIEKAELSHAEMLAAIEQATSR